MANSDVLPLLDLYIRTTAMIPLHKSPRKAPIIYKSEVDYDVIVISDSENYETVPQCKKSKRDSSKIEKKNVESVCNCAIKTSPSRTSTYKHPSVRNLLKQNKSLVLPKDVYESHISPVVPLDRGEIYTWYAEQLKIVKEKLATLEGRRKKALRPPRNVYNLRLRQLQVKHIFDWSDSD